MSGLIPKLIDLHSLKLVDANNFLQKITKEERILLMNLDIWHQDDFSIDTFSHWLTLYYNANDDLKTELATSKEFALYLKGAFNIATFDIEFPDYPDHDNFFITDDNSFIFEFDDSNKYQKEVRDILKSLYAYWGVPKVYNYLLSIIGISFYDYQEKLFARKKEELMEYGISDYLSALSSLNTFDSKESIDEFIKNRKILPFKITTELKEQTTLPELIEIDNFKDALSLVIDPNRLSYLNYSLHKLYNDFIIYHELYRKSKLTILEKTKEISWYLDLGFSYLNSRDLFLRFDFIDLFKIGKSLIQIARKNIVKNIDHAFIGVTIANFLESDTKEVKLVNGDILVIDSYANYLKWFDAINAFNVSVSLIRNLQKTLQELVSKNNLMDSFYLNYPVREIDLSALLLTMFANNVLENDANKKLGLSILEFKQFIKKIKEDMKIASIYASSHLSNFFMEEYFLNLVKELLSIDYDALTDQEFKHVDGVILLAE